MRGPCQGSPSGALGPGAGVRTGVWCVAGPHRARGLDASASGCHLGSREGRRRDPGGNHAVEEASAVGPGDTVAPASRPGSGGGVGGGARVRRCGAAPVGGGASPGAGPGLSSGPARASRGPGAAGEGPRAGTEVAETVRKTGGGGRESGPEGDSGSAGRQGGPCRVHAGGAPDLGSALPRCGGSPGAGRTSHGRPAAPRDGGAHHGRLRGGDECGEARGRDPRPRAGPAGKPGGHVARNGQRKGAFKLSGRGFVRPPVDEGLRGGPRRLADCSAARQGRHQSPRSNPARAAMGVTAVHRQGGAAAQGVPCQYGFSSLTTTC